jgi:hypothetical protein
MTAGTGFSFLDREDPGSSSPQDRFKTGICPAGRDKFLLHDQKSCARRKGENPPYEMGWRIFLKVPREDKLSASQGKI